MAQNLVKRVLLQHKSYTGLLSRLHTSPTQAALTSRTMATLPTSDNYLVEMDEKTGRLSLDVHC